MADAHGITHYDQMPIPPVEAQTRYFDASPISIGVQYRLLDDAIVAASRIETAMGNASGPSEFDDRGVALHIFGSVDGERLEYLRFDCFDEDPHYHYICWRDRSNRMIHIDPIAEGDPLDWALERIRTRLPQRLEFAGAPPDRGGSRSREDRKDPAPGQGSRKTHSPSPRSGIHQAQRTRRRSPMMLDPIGRMATRAADIRSRLGHRSWTPMGTGSKPLPS